MNRRDKERNGRRYRRGWWLLLAALMLLPTVGGCGAGAGRGADPALSGGRAELVAGSNHPGGGLDCSSAPLECAQPTWRFAILPFVNHTSCEQVDEAARRSFYGRFSPLAYRDVELRRIDELLASRRPATDPSSWAGESPRYLGRLLDAEVLVHGEVTSCDRLFLGAYSQVAVEIEIQMVGAQSGNVLWHERRRSVSREGGVPLSPLDIIPTLYRTATNMRDIELLRTVDDVSRQLVAAIPEPAATGAGARAGFPSAGPESTGIPATGPDAGHPPGPVAGFACDQMLDVDPSALLSRDRQAAVFCLKQALATTETAEYHFLLGLLHYEDGLVRAALARLRRAAELDPTNAGYHYNLGLALQEQGETAEALRHWRQAATLEPDNPTPAALIHFYDQARP